MKFLISFLLCLSLQASFSQSTAKSSSQLFEDLKRIGRTETVMYIAAHPDDENTRLISWFNNHEHVRVVYLSLTRGDGGQNLIGSEQGELLGLLRTQELLQARAIDGGEQIFTRANDFGYSKTATETLKIWNKDKVLGDVVYAIRKYQPDVIITRFDPDSNGKTHGHHTSSAILAMEAFDLANQANAYPEQLTTLQLWQPKRIFFNTSWWFYGSEEEFNKIDKSNFISMDVGAYYPLLGQSNNEIASLSRSKHACQGFGSELQRGSQTEWIKLLKGDMPQDGDVLQGINSRYPEKVKNQAKKILDTFQFTNPELSTGQLISLHQEVSQLPDSNWKTIKLNQIEQAILDLNGIYLEWTSSEPYSTSGQTISTTLEVSNRGTKPIQFYLASDANSSHSLNANETIKNKQEYTIASQSEIDNPYWLSEPMQSIGEYTISKPNWLTMPESPRQTNQNLTLLVDNKTFELHIPLQYKTIDPARGEKYEPFYIVPPVTVNIDQPVYLFPDSKQKNISVTVTSFIDNAQGSVQLDAGLDWIFSQKQNFNIKRKGEKQQLNFQTIPPKNQSIDKLTASINLNGQSYFRSLETVDYPHIDKQLVFRIPQSTIGKIDMKVPNVRVAYIEGSGDEVVESLQQVGLAVSVLPEENWSSLTNMNFDVAVVGIRAFNVLEHSDKLVEQLTEFATKGGTVIVQYQTYRGLKVDQFAPKLLKLSNDRIAQEDAELTMLVANHPIFTTPNQITQDDFSGWVQERGLYFASEWDADFTPLLAGHDDDESQKEGILLVAPVGEGQFVYTGLSFFRELPAGVPGAYRLFMNLLALD